MEDEYCKLLSVSRNTYYVHKREKRPIITLLEKYFTKEDLEEFLESGKIKKFENVNFAQNLLSYYRDSYFKYIEKNFRYINSWHRHLLVYYFKYLYFIKNNFHKFETSNRPFHTAAIAFGFEYEYEFTENEKSAFYLLFMLLDFLDSDKGMWYFFVFVLENDFKYFTENTEIDRFIKNGKIDRQTYKFGEGSPFTTSGVDHYYYFNCINNIHPYSIQDIWPKTDFAPYNIEILSTLTQSKNEEFELYDTNGMDFSFEVSKEEGHPMMMMNGRDVGISYQRFSSLMQNEAMAVRFGTALASLDLNNKESYNSVIEMLADISTSSSKL